MISKEFVKKLNSLDVMFMDDPELLKYEKELLKHKQILESLNKTYTELYKKIIHELKYVDIEKIFRRL